MSAHEAEKGGHKLGILEQIEVAGRHVASVAGGGVGATLTYLSGEAAFKTFGLIAQANEAGLISEAGGFSTVEAIKALGLGYAAFKTIAWTGRMHHVARAIEKGKRPTGRKH
mgnify:CR=1 FL=1